MLKNYRVYLYITIIGHTAQIGLAGRLRSWSSSPGGSKNFHFSMSSRLTRRSTQPPIQCVTGALSPEVKRPGRDADHSPPTSAEVKKTWIYSSIPPYAFMA
jgi:hypothetical protein